MLTLPTSIKAIKDAIFGLLLSVLFVAAQTAQAQTLTLGSVEACAAPEVSIALTGNDLSDVGSFTLYLTFDSTVLAFDTIINIDSQLTGMVYSMNQEPFQLAIVWSKVIPAQFMQKKLFDIRFHYSGHSTSLSFKANCEVSNTQLQILPVTFVNGSVDSQLPDISLQPRDTTVSSWAKVLFTTSASNTQSYLWKESTDNGQNWNELSDDQIHQGTRTRQLILSWAPPSFNKYKYLCVLNTQNCTAATLPATLTVDTAQGVPVHGSAKDFSLQNQPNPVKGLTTFTYNLPANGQVILEILDLCGSTVATPVTENQAAGSHSIPYDATGLHPGLYFYSLKFKNGQINYTASSKLIKISN